MRDPDESMSPEGVPFDDERDGGGAVALRAPRHRLPQPEHARAKHRYRIVTVYIYFIIYNLQKKH